MKKYNKQILITEPLDYSKRALSIYHSLGDVYFLPDLLKLKKKEIKSILEKIEILVVGLRVDINKKFLDQMPNLELIASPTTGLNHIDIKYIESLNKR